MRGASNHLKSMASSSSSSSITPELEHKVFLSFCGVDTRKKITSHLHKALCQKKIKPFIDDNLIKGEEISSSLLKAIKHSKISVIIFSKGYASSKWCLQELEEIVNCKNKYDQIIMPVFYEVDPSDVRNQARDFGNAFAVLEERFKDDSEMLQRWRTALTDAANISGFDSKTYRDEASLVSEIVEEILKKLDYGPLVIHTKRLVGLDSSMKRLDYDSSAIHSKSLVGLDSSMKRFDYDSSVIHSKSLVGLDSSMKGFNHDFSVIHTESLVGLDSSIEEIVNLLCTKGVRKVGIWGIGGIGKTTLASAVFKTISRQFEVSLFISNIREKSNKSEVLNNIREKVGRVLLGDTNPYIGSRERLNYQKALIVFDDVTADLRQMAFLMEISNYLDSESRIIITTRDKEVLAKYRVHHVHWMKELAFDKALQLFTFHAFRENNPPKDYIGLSSSVVALVQGLPLALKVVGSYLRMRTRIEWELSLEKLQSFSHPIINQVLRVSYERLCDKEKDTFLDIACFFKDYKRDLIEAILSACDLDSHNYINVLIERSLITNSFDIITMPNLLKNMGREIVQQESKYVGKRSRLWHHKDILLVLRCNMGTRAIRSISLDMSEVAELHLNPKSFNQMENLRFLEFYGSKPEVPESNSSTLWHKLRFLGKKGSNNGKKVHGFEKLESNFSELRYFCWHGYSAKSLPPNFNPKNLVVLYMHNSKVIKLWTGNQKLVNLKHIDLSHSRHLCRIPDFSLIPNLESLILEGCTNLCESFSSIHNLHKLVILNLQGCKGFDNLPISVHCKSLREVNLSNCSNLKTVPYLPCTVEELNLDGTAIKEVLSINHLFRLVKLSFRKCSRLERLPESIRELESLRCLYLSGCTKLDRLPNDLGNLTALEELELEEIALAEIPSLITSLINLKTLSFARYKLPKPLSIPLVHSSVFHKMAMLILADCCIEVLPNKIAELLLLEYLYLAQDNFESQPVSIKDLSKLRELHLRICQRLKSLPEFPLKLPNIERNLDVWYHLKRFLLNEESREILFNEAHRFKAMINIHSNIDVFKHIRTKLNCAQKQMFRQTCFGHFLDVEVHEYSAVLIQSVMFQQVNRGELGPEFWFRVNEVNCRFSPLEFAMVTGLILNKEVDFDHSIMTIGKPRFRERYFASTTPVTYDDLAQAFMSQSWGDRDEDAIKLATLYLLHHGMMGADNKNVIEDNILHLVDDWDAFNRFPWGTIVWAMTANSMSWVIQKRYEDVACQYPSFTQYILSQNYALRGFPLAFQLWIYETLSNLGDFVDCKAKDKLPRMIKWRTIKCPRKEDISNIFGASPNVVTPILIPSREEKESNWYRKALKYMGYTHEPYQHSSFIPSVRPMPSLHQATNLTAWPHYLVSNSNTWSPYSSTWSPYSFMYSAPHFIAPSPIPGPSPYYNVGQLEQMLITQKHLLCSFMDSVEQRFTSIDLHFNTIKSTIVEQQCMYSSHLSTTPPNKDESTEVIIEVSSHNDPTLSRVIPASNTEETFMQARSSTHRTFREGIVKKGQSLISPYIDPLRQRRPRDVIHPIVERDELDELVTFMTWYDEAKTDDQASTFLFGSRLKIGWWDALYEQKGWLIDEHIDSYLTMLRHSTFNANWTCVDTTFVGWLPNVMKTSLEVGSEYKWPRVLLDPIEGSNDKKNQGFTAWGYVDKVYIPINFDNKHWACGELDLSAWTFTVYDSLKEFIGSKTYFDELMAPYQCLPRIIGASNYWEIKGKLPIMKPFNICHYTNVPQQGVASGDCGVFTLMFIEYLASGRQFDFNANDSSRLRSMIAAKIYMHGRQT